MRKLTEVLNQRQALTNDIWQACRRFNPETLLEAVMLTDDDFGEPMDDATLIALLKNEGFSDPNAEHRQERSIVPATCRYPSNFMNASTRQSVNVQCQQI